MEELKRIEQDHVEQDNQLECQVGLSAQWGQTDVLHFKDWTQPASQNNRNFKLSEKKLLLGSKVLLRRVGVIMRGWLVITCLRLRPFGRMWRKQGR
jgi:hypothetical protein